MINNFQPKKSIPFLNIQSKKNYTINLSTIQTDNNMGSANNEDHLVASFILKVESKRRSI